MSRNEWEAGSVKIPTAAWPTVKEAIRAAQRKVTADNLAFAQELHAKLMATGKGKRDFDWRGNAETIAERMLPGFYGKAIDYHQVIALLLPYKRTGAPLAPKLKDFAPATGATKEFRCGEASLTFDEATKTIRYGSGDNNHARRDARDHPVIKAFFTALSQITDWTRGSGGEITGNDEYNRDARENGGGANYVTERFPPAKPKPPIHTWAHAMSGRRW